MATPQMTPTQAPPAKAVTLQPIVFATDFSAAFVHLWTVRDGRIVRFEQVADTFALLGTLPAEGQ